MRLDAPGHLEAHGHLVLGGEGAGHRHGAYKRRLAGRPYGDRHGLAGLAASLGVAARRTRVAGRGLAAAAGEHDGQEDAQRRDSGSPARRTGGTRGGERDVEGGQAGH